MTDDGGETGGWWARCGARVLIGCIAACVVGWAVVMVVLLRLDDTPGWWVWVDGADPAVLDEAERLERAFANQVSAVRPDAEGDGSEWAVAVSERSANAWLAARLRAWVENEGAVWPPEIESVRAGFVGERVALGARLGHGPESSVVWMTMTPEVRRDGSVWMRAHGAWVGGVSVPGSWALSGLEQGLARQAPEDAAKIARGPSLRDMLSGVAPVSVEPVVHLPDGRDVRILELRVREGRVEVVLRTEMGKGQSDRGPNQD